MAARTRARQRSRNKSQSGARGSFEPGYGLGQDAVAQANLDINKAINPAMRSLSSRDTTQAVNMTELLNRLTSQSMYGSIPMARDPRDRVPFGPLHPLIPAALDPSRPDTGRPGPRLTEYPVATNINTNRPLPWRVLRDAADNVDILRRCIEVRKADIRSLKWGWVVSDQAVAEAYRSNPARGKSDLAAELREKWMPDIRRLTEFWEHPWKSEGMDFGAWVNCLMEERLVLDAVCYSPDTEVLTEAGWKLFTQVDLETDRFATRNPKTRALEWQFATRFHEVQFDGELINFGSRSLDVLVTPDHRMLVAKTVSKSKECRPDRVAPEMFETAAEVAKSTNRRIPSTSTWVADDVTEVRLDPTPRPGSLRPHALPFVTSGDDFAALMGMYLSEGSVTGTGGRDRIAISQEVKSKGYEPFRALLARILGGAPTRNGGNWVFRRKALSDYLRQFGHSHEKFVPLLIKGMSRRQLEIFWEYYLLGDGWREPSGRESIVTASKRMADDLQEIAQKIGYSASIQTRQPAAACIRGRDIAAANLRETYTVSLRTAPYQRITQVSRVPYSGLVYCVSVPNETLYVRRNNKPAWCGNCLYPQTTYGGDLLALEIIDGSSIKPLRDYRGARPSPPFPAFQQILYGFPRGEWQATVETDADGNEVVNGGFLADQMLYHRENARSWTPYGFSPTEQALISARLYLKRQGWMLSEYDDGVLPSMLIESTETLSLTPNERRAYEAALNDELTGQTQARHRGKFMFPGTKVTLLPDVAERYKPEYDLFLIKLLASHFGVSATKLGFSETKGLGGSGMHEAQAQNEQDLGVVPDREMVSSIVATTSRRWLNAPPEIEFKMFDDDGENEQVRATITVGQLGSAQKTTNEARAESGQPVLPIPEADMPYILTATGPVFLEGASAPKPIPGATGAAAANSAADQAQSDPAADESDDDAEPTGKAITKHAGPDHVSAQAVIDQLAPDYPPESMGWIHGAHWTGPRSVPLSRVDFDDADSWDATTDDKKVDRFADGIRAGKMKPVVLVQVPGDDQYKVIDGHHRALAYRKLNRPVTAWVGKVGAKVGPWTQMHSSQHVGSDTGLEPTSGAPAGSAVKAATWNAPSDDITPKAAPVDPAKLAEIRAYKSWVRKRPNAARPFAFVHLDDGEQAALLKAAADDPKEPAAQTPPPVEPDTRWPAWAVDTLVATYWAAKLRQALTSGLDTQAIAQEWARDTAAWESGDVVPDALSWLRANGVDTTAIVDAIGPVLRDAATVGYSVGSQSAAAAIEGDARIGVTVDWSAFKPGSVAAARKVLSADGMDVGLEQLLAEYDVTISGIAEHRLDELAAVLADGLEMGKTPQEIAKALRGLIDDPGSAMTIAWTETNRAQSSAALDRYRARGVDGKEWFTAHDQRVCTPICKPNEDEGPIPLDQAFQSGDQCPPGHPRCRCAPLPATLPTPKTS